MNEVTTAQLKLLTHDEAVHATLLMDLLRLVHWIDPAAYQLQVEQAERELRAASTDPTSPTHDRGAHHVLEQRLAYLRAVQIGPTSPG